MARKDVQEVSVDTLSKPEYSLKKGTRPKISWPVLTWLFPGHSLVSHALFLASIFSLLPGFEAAQLFLKARQVPGTWKVDLSEILESSSSDEDDVDEDGEGKDAEEEEEKEPEPEEVRLQYFFVISNSCFVPETSFPLKAICQMLKILVCCWHIQKWMVLENCSLVFQNCEEVIYLFIFFLFDSYGILVYALAWTLVSWSQ